MKIKKKKIRKIIFIISVILMFFLLFFSKNLIKNLKVSKTNLVEVSKLNSEPSEVIKFDSVEEYEELKELMIKYDEEIEKNNIINISECTEEFMEKYFEEASNLNKDIYENIENITKDSELKTLIVTAKSKLSENYGAVKVIEAPNNQYFLKYNSDEETEKAYESFSNSNEIICVDYDKVVKINTDNLYNEENNVNIINSTNYNSWGIESMGLDKIIPNCPQDNEIVVAIIDTGCNVNLLNENYNGKLKGTYNAINASTDVSDAVGHGTHIAGTIAEGTPNNVKILPVKVSDKTSILESDIITALNYVISNNRANVINMSFGSEISGSKYVVFKAANEKNIVCVAASGNDGKKLNFYPAAFDNTISVGAYDNINYEKADFSNYTSTITFCAPGSKIKSINGVQSGTSMATPHVACAAALLKCFNKDISFDETVECLKNYCVDLGVEGKDDWYGYGMINFNNATLCNCNCSNCKGLYCNSCDCNNCIYEKPQTQEPTKIEFLNLVGCDMNNNNFYSLSNLAYSKVKIYYGEKNYEIKYLFDLEGVEISGYDCNNSTNNIVVKYKDFVIEGTVDGNPTGERGWVYTNSGGIKLTIYNDDKIYSSVKKLYIPDMIGSNKIISLGDGLLKDRVNIKEVIVPDGIKNIGNEVFSGCNGLKKVIIPGSVANIGTDVFKNCGNVVLYVEANSYAEKYAKNNNIKYVLMDSEVIDVKLIDEVEKVYHVFDVVDTSNLKVEVTLKSGNIIQYDEGFTIKYMTDNSCFKYGDTKYTIEYNKDGIEFSLDVEVVVEKLKPEYSIPTGLKIIENSKISELKLPNGFEWQNPNQLVGEKGIKVFKAKYTPEDTSAYEIIENIDISVEVYEKNEINIVENALNVFLCNNLISGKKNVAVIQYCNNTSIKNVTKVDAMKAKPIIKDIKNKDNKSLNNNDKVKTGDIAVIDNMEYTCIVYGDANGDGIICDIDDIMIIINDFLGKKKVTNENRLAADLSGSDNKLDIDDVMRMINVYLGKYKGNIYNILYEKIIK